MGRIKNEDLYILDQTVSGNDRLIGSDGDDLKKTKNFSVDDLLGYFQDNNPTDYVLPTATDVILGGVKIDGTTITITDGVISASADVIASGLEEITENGNTGWRFIGEPAGDNINRYFIGDKAIDGMQFRGNSVGFPDVPSLPFGTKSVDGINFGVDNKDNATFNTTVLGTVNQTNAYAFATMIGGYNNIGYGYGDVCIGSYNTTNPSNVNSFLFAMGHNVRMNGELGGVGIGLAVTNNSRGAVVVGTSNVPWAGGVRDANRPSFTVGIGTTTTPQGRWQPLVQKDGLNVLFTGEVIANSVTNALIDAEPTGKVLTTREWIEGQSFLTSAPNLQAVTDIGATTTNNLEVIGDTISFDVHNVAYTYGSYASINPAQSYSGCYTPTGDGYFKSEATQTESTVIFQGTPDRKLSMIATASNVVVEFLTNAAQSITIQPTISAGIFTQTLQAATGTIALKEVGYTVATLPVSPTIGDRAYVTDATAPTYLGTLTGGGAVVCPVFYNGSAWVSV